MPKPANAGSWYGDKSTEAQHLKLLLMLKDLGEIEPKRGEDVFDFEQEAISWISENCGVLTRSLADLTKGQISNCIRRCEEEQGK